MKERKNPSHKNWRAIAIAISISFCSFFTATAQTVVGVGAGGGVDNSVSHFGFQVGPLSTGISNTFLGSQTGQMNTLGWNNTFIGHNAGNGNLVGHSNTFIGMESGMVSTGSSNVFLGAGSGRHLGMGGVNTFLGSGAGFSRLDGTANVLVGHGAGQLGEHGDSNVMVGTDAGWRSNGLTNVYIGHQSARDNIAGNYNTYLGFRTGFLNDGGSENTFLGWNSGAQSTGSSNIFIGYEAGENAVGNDLLFIDNSNTLTPLIWGNFDTDQLIVNGGLTITNTSQDDALERMLAIDGSGRLYFRDAATLGGGGGGTPHDDPFYPNSADNGIADNSNSHFGHRSGQNNSGLNNTFVGSASGQQNSAGSNNAFLGYNSGFNNNGDHNTYIGGGSGEINETGSQNTMIGHASGALNEGSGNVFLGNESGRNETGSNRLYIDNSETSFPLIWGNFETDEARVHGEFSVSQIPNDDTMERVLVTNASGTLHYRDAATLGGGGGTPHDRPFYPNSADNGIANDTNAHFGFEAGLNNSANHNAFVGYRSGLDNTTGGDNTFVGSETGANNTTGTNNTFVGSRSGWQTTSSYNSFFGSGAGRWSTTGNHNVFLGANSGLTNSTGASNTFVGSSSGSGNVTGGFNTYIGTSAGTFNSVGSANTLIGNQAGSENASGNENTMIGRRAGFFNLGSGNVFLGYNAGHDELGSNHLYIDNSATPEPLIYGNFDDDQMTVNGGLTVTDMPQDDSMELLLATDETGHIYLREANTIGGGGGGTPHDAPFYPNSAGTPISHTNSHFGDEAGLNNADANNTFIGYRSGMETSTGHDNTFVGTESGRANIDGNWNTYIGKEAGEQGTNGAGNTLIGYEAGQVNQANFNNFIGMSAGQSNINGVHNTFVGAGSGSSNTSGSSNAFLGNYAGSSNISGDYNVLLGVQAGNDLETGSNNTFLGHLAGSQNVSGSGNVFIGRQAGRLELGSDQLYIDNSSTSEPLVWGDFANDEMMVNGELSVRDIPQDDALTQVLVADANGLIHFRDAATLGMMPLVGPVEKVLSDVNMDSNFKIADSKIAKNVKESIPGLEFVNKLRPVSYWLASDGPSDSESVVNGFLGEEVEQIVKDGNYEFSGLSVPVDDKGHYSIRYEDFVPTLVKSVKELSAQLKEQQIIIAELSQQLESITKDEGFVSKATIMNYPNPFSGSTTIKAFVPENLEQVRLKIFTLEGKELKSAKLAAGENSLQINANELENGMYVYAIVGVSGKIYSTERMIKE